LKPEGQSVAEELDTLNAQTRASRNAPNKLRRTIETTIEAKAKRRRSREGAASAGWKRAA
jgi:hypothetical protein